MCLAQAQSAATDALPVLQGVFNGLLDTVLVVVMSIYLLIDRERVAR
jgi:hypothetical protein